jgi:hypothetical protein
MTKSNADMASAIISESGDKAFMQLKEAEAHGVHMAAAATAARTTTRATTGATSLSQRCNKGYVSMSDFERQLRIRDKT